MRDDKTERSFAFVNRHFANYPLARDARISLHWRKSQKTGRWLCGLPGSSEVQFRLPEDTPAVSRHWPSALDMNVLFLLLSEATRRKARERLCVDEKLAAAVRLGTRERGAKRGHILTRL